MGCIICQKKVSEGDCCKKCEDFYKPDEINAVRMAKAQAEMWKARAEEALEAEKERVEELRRRIREFH